MLPSYLTPSRSITFEQAPGAAWRAAPHPGRQMTDVAPTDDEPPSLLGVPWGAPMSAIDRGRARPHRLLHPLERVLRLGGVRVRLRAPHAPRRARRRGQSPRAHGAQDRRRPVALHRGDAARHHALLGRARRPRRARGRDACSRAVFGQRLDVGRDAPSRSVLAFVVISILHVVIGEIVPKSYTLPRAEQVALAVAPLIGVFFFVFAWFISFLDWLAQLVMRMLGITPTDELEGSHSEVELRMLLRQGERAGVLEAEEQQMIDKVFDFSDTPGRGRHGAAPRHRRAAGRADAARRRWSRCCSTRTRATRSTTRSSTTCSASCTCAGCSSRCRTAPPRAPTCARCCIRRTSCPRPSGSASC